MGNKLRFSITQFVNDWKWSAGFNVQNSSYKNGTSFLRENIFYETDLNFFKYGLFLKARNNFFNQRLNISLGIRTDADTFSTGSNLIDNFSPRLSFSYSLSGSKMEI